MKRRGITVLELVIAIAIAALLMAISIPAIVSSREVARRAQCTNNLHEIGVGLVNFEAVHRHYPPGKGKGGIGLHGALLPFVGHDVLARSLKWVDGDPQTYVPNGNRDACNVKIPIYGCPSDPQSGLATGLGYGTNYAGNCGSFPMGNGFDGVFYGQGVYRKYPTAGGYYEYFDGRQIRASDVRDGLSNTVALAEILMADQSRERLRAIWNTHATIASDPDHAEEFARVCAQMPTSPQVDGNYWERGTPWLYGEILATLYNHALPPNSPSCFVGLGNVQLGVYSASSLHSAYGVNALYLDGSVKFVNESVDIAVWRDAASRAGCSRLTGRF